MVEEKKTINRVLALLMVFVVVVSAIGFAPMRGEAAPAPTPVTLNSVTYNNTGLNPSITVDFTDVDDRNNADIVLAQPNGPGNGIGDIEFNGETCGLYSFSTINMATATSLGGHRYTASLPTYLGDDGTKPGVGLTVYVGILVSNTNDEDNTTAIDLVSLVVPAEGQSITVRGGGGTPQQQCDHVNTTRTRHSTSSNTQHEVRCGTCGAVVEMENHVWNQDAYQENGNSHSRVCTLCGYNDTHTIDSDGYWLTVGTQQTCRGPGCRTCRQPVSVSRVSDLSQICHQIRLEANPSKTTHKAWCARCGYEFAQNAPCFDTVDWYHLAPDNIDEDVIDWVESHYLHENGNGTATITCACGNTKTVNMKGKIIDSGNVNPDLDANFSRFPGLNENQAKVKTEPLISDADFSKLLNSINENNSIKQELEQKMAQQGIDNIETATVTAEVGSVNINLTQDFQTTGTGENSVSTATLDVSMGFRLKFTSGNKEINIDQDFNMLVEKPTLIRVPVPNSFGNDGDPVKVEHTHQGKEYVYYGKVLQITNDPVIGTCKVVEWTSENGLSPFRLTRSAAVTAEYKANVNTGNTSYNLPIPLAKTGLVANGSPQALVTAGSGSGYTVQYVLGTNESTMPTEGWSTSIPTGTQAGTYYVWYKLIADNNHRDASPGCVTVTISAPGSSSGSSGSSSGSSNSGPSDTSGENYTITNSDGSITKIKTITNKKTGTVTDTVTTTYTDGSKKVVKTVTNEDGSGSFTQTNISKDGSEKSVSSVREAGGKVMEIGTSSVSANQKSHTEAKYTVSGKKLTLVSIDTNEKSADIPAKIVVDFVGYKVTKVGAKAFAGNKKLTSATIGKNVVSIGANAFNGASGLKTLVIKGKVTSVGKNAFNNINNKAVIKIDASKKNYKTIKTLITKSSSIPKTVKFKRI